MAKIIERTITLDPATIIEFCGRNDSKIREIERQVDAKIILRGNEIRVMGPAKDVEEAVELINDLLEVYKSEGKIPETGRLRPALNAYNRNDKPELKSILLDRIPVAIKRRHVTPVSPGQKKYVDAIRNTDIVFCIGPAGTGKTYLAMAMAVTSLISGQVGRIILVRPAVEAGERLGFLPGDIAAKFDPYVRPLWDALYEMIEPEKIKQYIDNGIIEIAPLAFMRGRTLNNAFVILDEAQNTTIDQMKMFLTRLGFDSKAVITGDITQIDLPPSSTSGLVHVQKVLKGIEGISIIYLDQTDVVRHELVKKIFRAYELNGRKETKEKSEESSND